MMTRAKKSSMSFESLSDKLSEDGKLIVSSITLELQKMRDEFIKLLEEKDAKIGCLEGEIAALKGKVAKLESRVDGADAFERKNTLILSGKDVPNAASGEVPVNIVCETIKIKLKVKISPSDVADAFRIGRQPIAQQPDTRRLLTCQAVPARDEAGYNYVSS